MAWPAQATGLRSRAPCVCEAQGWPHARGCLRRHPSLVRAGALREDHPCARPSSRGLTPVVGVEEASGPGRDADGGAVGVVADVVGAEHARGVVRLCRPSPAASSA